MTPESMDTTDWNTRLSRLIERPDLQGRYPGKGRVLRVKLGYNPNSSSVGSVVTVLMWTVAMGSVVLNVMATLARQRMASGMLLGNEEQSANTPPDVPGDQS
jgi:hypothetical protein